MCNTTYSNAYSVPSPITTSTLPLTPLTIFLTLAADLQKGMTIQGVAIDKLYQSMTQLDSKILEAKRQKDTIIARARTAKTSVQGKEREIVLVRLRFRVRGR
jgi:hypothetical protein